MNPLYDRTVRAPAPGDGPTHPAAGPADAQPAFRPLAIVDVDLAEGLPAIPAVDPATGEVRGGAWCLIRSGGQPVRILEIAFEEGSDGIGADAFEERARSGAPRPPAPPLPRLAASDERDVTVVIATRDRADSLARCLDSLMVQDYGRYDIVVVDNAPATAATAELVRSRYASSPVRVRYVREDRAGLGRAHNAGLAVSGGDLLAFTDDDVLVDRDWVGRIAANFAASPRVGCVTGLILPAELKTRAQYWTERHGGFGKGLERIVYDLDEHRPADPLFPLTAGAFGSGANMAFSRQALDAVGGFDSALGAGTLARGGDDLASFAAVVRAGFQLVYEPGAIVWHHHRREEAGMWRQAYGYGMGLGAYLTSAIIKDPRVGLFLLRRLPVAVAHMAGGKSAKMNRLPDDYPRHLVHRERLGILMGVPGYLRSLRAIRRADGVRVDGTVAGAGAK